MNNGTILAGATAIVAAAIIAFFTIDIGALPLFSIGAGAALVLGAITAGFGGIAEEGIALNIGSGLTLYGLSYLVVGVAFPSLSNIGIPGLPYGLVYLLEILASYLVLFGTVWFMTKRGVWSRKSALSYFIGLILVPFAAVVAGGAALLQSSAPIPTTGTYTGGEGVIAAYILFITNDIVYSTASYFS